MEAQLVFLGSSASLGVPVLGCTCHVCESCDTKNKRLRPSALLLVDGKKYLIDAGPDLRAQALNYKLTDLDGVLLTHTHFDHIAGLDDLRVFSFLRKKPLPLLLSKSSYEDLHKRYFYLFKSDIFGGQRFAPQILEKSNGSCSFEGLNLSYFSYIQVGMRVTGFRFKNFAFVTDIKEYEDTIFDELKGVEILILSALDWEPTRAHIGVNQAIEIATRVGAKKAYLTHIGHELEYKKTNEALPEFFQLAYDGLKIDFEI